MFLSRTKTYYRRDERRVKFRGGLGFALVLSLLFVAILVSPLRAPVSRGLASVAVPVWSGENAFGRAWSSLEYLFTSKKTLAEENRKLRENLSAVARESLSVSVLREENTRLKEMLGRPGADTSLLANVIVRPNRTPYDVLIIDVGSDSGITVGDLVFAEGDLAIGTIMEVSDSTAKVSLFSSPDHALSVLVGDSHVEATAYGLGGGNFQIALARGIDVKVGDVISVPDLSVSVLGILESIRTSPTSPTQLLLFKLPVNFQELKWVFVRKANVVTEPK